MCDEARDALPSPADRAFAANVNVTVVRIANKAMSAALQLPVEFVEHRDSSSNGESGPPCGVPSPARTDQPVSPSLPAFRNAADQLQQTLVLHPSWRSGPSVCRVDSIEELLQIEIDHPALALSRCTAAPEPPPDAPPTRSKPIAVFGERRSHCLCRTCITACWIKRSSTVGMPSFRIPSVRLRDFHPPHRFRFVGPVQQLLPNSRPVLLQVVAQS